MLSDNDLSPSLFERPKTFEDMSGRKAFQAPLDHTQHVLKAVLSDYHFERQAPCGLKGCRQWHNTGLLVVTESGAETNIGQICGRTHFGAEAVRLARDDYEKRKERAELVARAKRLQEEAPGIVARINDLMYTQRYGVKWLTSVRREIYAVIGRLLESLEVLQNRADFQVKEHRRRSAQEIEDLIALSPGMTYAMARDATEVVGSLEPMPWLVIDFKQRLVRDLLEPLERFSTLSPALTESPKLKERLKQFEGYAKTLEDAENAAASAVRFLADDNLRLVALGFPEYQKEKADALRAWIGSAKHKALLLGNQ